MATNMAGRGTDIKLGGNPEFRARKRAGTNATEEQYKAALAIEKENWKKDYEEVKALGGLYVIGTERHESRRIDNQLRGRSGRQGDPGRSKFYISMDDDLMRLFGGERMKAMMSRIGMQPGEPIDHPWLNKGIEKAQQKVEDRNFEIRKHLLDYDDVLNEQRTVIYEQRDTILGDNNLSERVMNNAREEVENLFDNYEYEAKHNKNSTAPLAELQEKIRNTFAIQLPSDSYSREAVIAALQNDITEKETLAGKENFNMFIRYQYIQMIDKKWLDQLETLEGLREAVALRSYGSKNPLTEYKIDGFNIFDEMLETIRNSVMSRVFRVRVQLSPEAAEARRRMLEAQQQGMNAQHSEAGNTAAQMAQNTAERSAHSSFNGDQARRQAVNSAMNQRSQGDNITVRRTMPKVGRNDPCPCGSGKKYKNCCGR